ncbi:MAG: polysaccharide deacetylase family protein [Chitinispirillales bacterium]|jgi:peptidoglycan/xylan/chitin deacetylase (PgdA/CDA1 family)|nr:polysaccharide deacetylase family protein [Chitinispirillales bacterium]
MRKQNANHKPRAPSTRGAATPKTIIAVATVLLSVSASVFTFLLLTRVETWLNDRRAASEYRAADTSANADAEYTASPPSREPSFSVAETYIPAEERASAARGNPQPQPPSFSLSQASTPEQAYAPAPAPTQAYADAQAYRPPQTPIDISPRGAGVPSTVDNGSETTSFVALTFDGGSHANAAADILDTLASRGVKSTMFLTGAFIRKYPQVVINIAMQGHELGNHTMNHPRLTTYADNMTQTTRSGISRQSIINELSGAARALADHTGLRFAPLWRAPYGEYNREICRWAIDAGYIHIGWRQGGSWRTNLDTNDWVPNASHPGYKSPEEVFDKIINIAKKPGGLNGGIILMHLGTERSPRSQQVHIILGRLIDALRSMGYEPTTVSDLLYQSGVDVSLIGND